ncbi:hypothetical protein ACE6H2_026410 [Prunus campanulata]
MTLVTMIFALLGFLSPSNRGLMIAMVLLWVFMVVQNVQGYRVEEEYLKDCLYVSRNSMWWVWGWEDEMGMAFSGFGLIVLVYTF